MPAFPDPEPEVLQDRADRPVVLVGDRVRHPSQPWIDLGPRHSSVTRVPSASPPR